MINVMAKNLIDGSEIARLFGMDFISVLSRGSQYQVESVLMRITKKKNFVMISPSSNTVSKQAALECIALVMEPYSSVYHDPVVVLDFQSLYPSLMIAYNLCYSTYLGRFERGQNAVLQDNMGVVSMVDNLEASNFIASHGDQVFVSPNGCMFCPHRHRRGVLSIMLEELLNTRVMVKKELKVARQQGNDVLARVLDARQLALKMIANVTYGYTSASFSGRMPCAQLADAIVSSGRCTLEKAVELVESNETWKAKVIYGDTDSIFVHLPGRSKREAFQIADEIIATVNKVNPPYVLLIL